MGKPRDGGASATWERDVKIIFCDLCLKEIELGNRPTTHFNKEGWLNLMKSFQEKTGREYDKIQLKNKWDQLKKDWKLWKELKRGSTGLGWDPKKKTIDASDEWWKDKLEAVPNAKKFRYCGIDPELEDKLDLMFMGVVATGVHAWAPTQGLEYQEPQGDSDQQDACNTFEEQMQNMDSHIDSTHSKRQPSKVHTVERKRRHGAEFLRSKIDLIVAACTQNNSIPNAVQAPIQPPQLSLTIKVLEEISEVFEDIPLYLFSTKLLEDPNKREVFMSMSPERRVYYLRYWFENREV